MRQCACVEDGARKNTTTRTQSDPQRSHCTTEDDWNCAEQLEAGPFTCLTHSQQRQAARLALSHGDEAQRSN